MSNFKVGIMLDSLRLGFERGIDKAAEIGADGFQMYYCRKEPTPKDEIAFQRSYIEKNGLYVAAICGDIGPYSDESQHASRFEIMENVFNYTHELGANVVTGHIGWIPADKDHPQYRAIHKGMLTIGKLARERGITFAIETGPETAAVLRTFLDDLEGGVGVNFDPANLVMGAHSANGADSVEALAPYIVHTHAKDGVRIDGQAREVALGTGSVDFPLWMSELKKHGYRGFLTIEREVGDDPVGDCTEAIRYLRAVDATV
ncbi:MAG: sugar phosphate isomerase/epimerase [Ruminococcaceae bacterium]|nr:sugar phosphate isomerase/epimerase [Oscillospiraceae bacterium]